MNKEKLLAILIDIENGISLVDANLAIFELVEDESIAKVAGDIKSRLSTILSIELEDLKEYVGQL